MKIFRKIKDMLKKHASFVEKAKPVFHSKPTNDVVAHLTGDKSVVTKLAVIRKQAKHLGTSGKGLIGNERRHYNSFPLMMKRINDLKYKRGLTLNDIAVYLGKSPNTISSYNSIQRYLPLNVQEKIQLLHNRNGAITLSHARELSIIYKDYGEKAGNELFEKVQEERLNISELHSMVKSYQNEVMVAV